MSKAQTVQLVITLAGIALAMVAFLAGPFEVLGNVALSLVIFFVSGAIAGYAYAKLAKQSAKAADLRDRVDNPPS